MEHVLQFKYTDKGKLIYPANKLVKHWIFTEEEEKQAYLAHALGEVAEVNGVSTNDLAHLFPAILRMLKDKSEWAGN